MRSLRWALLSLVALTAPACGPINSTRFIIDAEVQIQAARTAGAEKLAPYEWTLANLYIKKAREEVGSSDYQVANDFAEKASKNANLARERALQVGRDETPASGATVSP
jgi:hypothetical protein